MVEPDLLQVRSDDNLDRARTEDTRGIADPTITLEPALARNPLGNTVLVILRFDADDRHTAVGPRRFERDIEGAAIFQIATRNLTPRRPFEPHRGRRSGQLGPPDRDDGGCQRRVGPQRSEQVEAHLRDHFGRDTKTRKVLEAIADENWVHFPYGIEAPTDDEGEQVIDEKGVHHVYDQSGEPSPSAVDALKEYLLNRDATARRERRAPPVRNAFDGPSLWLGADPRHVVIAGHHLPVDLELDLRDERQFHLHLRSLTWKGGELDWTTRALAMQAVRRVALRQSMLVRLLPTDLGPNAQLSAETLVHQFTKPLGGKGESLLRRLGVFLEDLASASGDISDRSSARGALLDASRIRPKHGVALVTGGSDAATRNRYFNGFNTPLEPEVLICTSVGQEGIDLHRQCRHVYHYDLTWNPATLEQRTGRIDRIGCLAQRERQLEARAASNGNGTGAPQSLHYLDISVPYLAATYDERMYEELRLRSQVFEVLTGGELAPDAASGKPSDDDAGEEDEGSERAQGLVVLPEAMIEELRVDLRVWGRSSREQALHFRCCPTS